MRLRPVAECSTHPPDGPRRVRPSRRPRHRQTGEEIHRPIEVGVRVEQIGHRELEERLQVHLGLARPAAARPAGRGHRDAGASSTGPVARRRRHHRSEPAADGRRQDPPGDADRQRSGRPGPLGAARRAARSRASASRASARRAASFLRRIRRRAASTRRISVSYRVGVPNRPRTRTCGKTWTQQVTELRREVLVDVEPIPRRHARVEPDGRVWRRQDHLAARPRHPSDLAQVGQRIGNVLEHLEAASPGRTKRPGTAARTRWSGRTPAGRPMPAVRPLRSRPATRPRRRRGARPARSEPSRTRCCSRRRGRRGPPRAPPPRRRREDGPAADRARRAWRVACPR